MKQYWLIGVVVLVVLGGLWVANTRTVVAPAGGGTVCTMDAKLCPDGSYVGRTGPNCEFATCPGSDASSTTGGGSILPYTSGVRGSVLLGPTCPVMRDPPDPGCADKPYATAISVYRTGSKSPFIIGSSNASGTFEFSLPPGSYTLTAGSGTTLPRCNPVDVMVDSTGYVTTTISCDTGIR